MPTTNTRIKWEPEQKDWYVEQIEALRDAGKYQYQALEEVHARIKKDGAKGVMKGRIPTAGSLDKWTKAYLAKHAPEKLAARSRKDFEQEAPAMGSEAWYAQLPELEERAASLQADLDQVRREIQKRKAMQLLDSGVDIDSLLDKAEAHA